MLLQKVTCFIQRKPLLQINVFVAKLIGPWLLSATGDEASFLIGQLFPPFANACLGMVHLLVISCPFRSYLVTS